MQKEWEDLIKATSGDIKRLDDVWRYSSVPVTVRENVSAHSFWVAVYAVMIHRKVHPNDTSYIPTIMLRALTHDVNECISGDIVRVFKYSTPQLKAAVDEAEEKLADQLPSEVRDLVSLNVCFPHHDETYVETIVKAADFLSLFHYMRREAMRHNFEIIPFFNRMVTNFSKMSKESPVDVNRFKMRDFYMALYRNASHIGHDCFQGNQLNDKFNRTV